MAGALRSPLWDQVRTAAKEWLHEHPHVPAQTLGRSARLADVGAAAAYAVVTANSHREARQLGAQPCTLCGLWTRSWCEACEPPPHAVCRECDGEKQVCPVCEAEGKSWEAARAQKKDPPGVLQVSGFTNEDGSFQRLDPPLEIPISEVTAEGGEGIDETQVAHRIAEAWSEQCRRASSSRATRGAGR